MPTSIDKKLDYEPIAGEKPVLKHNPMTIDEIRFELEPKNDETSASARLYWDWHNKEWVAYVYGEYLKGTCCGEQVFGSFETGPLRLNEPACRKVLKAYNVPEAEITLENAGVSARTKFTEIYKLPEGIYDIRLVSVTTPRVFMRYGKK